MLIGVGPVFSVEKYGIKAGMGLFVWLEIL
jgi:hypothetical protein